jgi:hypothetical protein
MRMLNWSVFFATYSSCQTRVLHSWGNAVDNGLHCYKSFQHRSSQNSMQLSGLRFDGAGKSSWGRGQNESTASHCGSFSKASPAVSGRVLFLLGGQKTTTQPCYPQTVFVQPL